MSSQATAHLISAGFGSITITHDQTRLLIGVPVSLFKGIDQDGDGLLQPDEIQEGRARMIEQLQSAIQLRLGEHVGVTVDDQLMVSVKLDQKSSTNQIEWLRFLEFSQDALTQPVSLSMAPEALSVRYMVQVRRGGETEAAVLSTNYPSHTFLKTVWGTFFAFLEQGVVHIIAGYDHVLFLLTLLISAVSMRRWLVVLSSFTLAHGITYALATFEVVQVSPQLIEPVIAFTIVLAAVVQLLGWRPALSVEAASVFSLGLFHGLGFASSMAEIFKEQRFPLSSVLGFNAGVEIGQVAIAGLLGLLMAGLSRCPSRWPLNKWLPGAVAWLAVVVGGYWFVQRVWL